MLLANKEAVMTVLDTFGHWNEHAHKLVAEALMTTN
jgi:hypothetical protein